MQGVGAGRTCMLERDMRVDSKYDSVIVLSKMTT